MPEYLAPGVYIEEFGSTAKTIESASSRQLAAARRPTAFGTRATKNTTITKKKTMPWV